MGNAASSGNIFSRRRQPQQQHHQQQHRERQAQQVAVHPPQNVREVQSSLPQLEPGQEPDQRSFRRRPRLSLPSRSSSNIDTLRQRTLRTRQRIRRTLSSNVLTRDAPNADIRPTPSNVPSRQPSTSDLDGNRVAHETTATTSDGSHTRLRPGEDQAAMISRLLSVAATATAASLVGSNERAMSQAQDVASNANLDSMVDGSSFDSFLEALRSGRLATALRNGGNELGGGISDQTPEDILPMNFFRMFRFSGSNNDDPVAPRLIPVIIVGIRSVPARQQGSGVDSGGIPLLDALGDFPVNLPSVSRASSPARATSTPPSPPAVPDDLHSTDEPSSSADTPSHQPRASSSDRAAGLSEPNGQRGVTRSWIIYVLGGSYPDSHPILTTPSLFTDSPTYEDMLLLSSIIGPAKPPVATSDEVKAAGGLYTIRDCQDTIVRTVDRCLVCLSDYQTGEVVRSLRNCEHTFHKECIDEWLLTGRNSCPLCRQRGVGDGTSETSNDINMEDAPTVVA